MSIESGRKLSGNFYSSRDSKDFEVFCDTGDSKHGCHGAKDFEDETFRSMIDKLKEAGWQIWKDEKSGEFKHRCPACKKAKQDAAMETFRERYNTGD